MPACIKPTKTECPVADCNCIQATQTCEQPSAKENSMDRNDYTEFHETARHVKLSISVGIDVSLPDICIGGKTFK